jgi:hypothetical protein
MTKRKKSVIICVAAAVVLILIAMSIYFITAPKKLGEISRNYSEQTTVTSDISFDGKAGDKIKFSFKSNVKNGDLDIVLYDSENNAVYKLDRAKALETFFTLTALDTYTLAAECSNFIGSFEIIVYKS